MSRPAHSQARQHGSRSRARHWQCLGGALLIASPTLGSAAVALYVAGNSAYQYDSNVFELQRGSKIPGLNTSGYGDAYESYGGTLNSAYLWGQQRAYLTLVGTDYQYNHFTELDHSEYTLDGGWKWVAGPLFDGTIDLARVRSMVNFYNLINSRLTLQTEQRESGLVGFQFVPDWRAELSGLTHTIAEPTLGAPSLHLDESWGQFALKYNGTAGVTGGVAANYLAGQFTGTGTLVQPDYHQVSASLTATAMDAISSFTGVAGYSRRSSISDFNSASGVTGNLDYKRMLTGKTSMEVDVNREINPYITGYGSEIDTNAIVNATWQATDKIAVALGYNWIYRDLPDQGNTPGTNRYDHLNFVSLGVDYEALNWLAIRPYVRYWDRTSTYVGGQFTESIVGVQLVVQFQNSAAAAGLAPQPVTPQLAPAALAPD